MHTRRSRRRSLQASSIWSTPIQLVAVDVAAHGVRHEVPQLGRRLGRGRATSSRRCRSRACRRTSPAPRLEAARSPARPRLDRFRVAQRRPASPATRTRSGSRQLGNPTAMSPPTIRNNSLSGVRECSFLQGYRACTTVPPWSPPRRRPRTGPHPPPPPVGTSSRRCSTPGWWCRPACRGGVGAENQHHASEAELNIRLLGAHQVTNCGRIERSAEDPDSHDLRDRRRSRADVAGALDQVLEGAQLTNPDRAASMELLGRVVDLARPSRTRRHP